MRILLVHNYYQQRGGEDVAVESELQMLRANGHDADLFSVHNDAVASLHSKAAAALSLTYNPRARSRLVERIRSFRPDIVHVHNVFPLLSPSVFDACRAEGVPSVLTLHNFRTLCPTGLMFHNGHVEERSLRGSSLWAVPEKAYRSSFFGTLFVAGMVDFHKWAGTWRKKVDGIIALTDFAKAKFVEGGMDPTRIFVKGNAVADPGPDTQTAPRHGALYVGRLSEEKGIASLLAAWNGVDYPLRIVGDGPLRAACKAQRNAHISYTGRLPAEQVYAEMRRAAFLIIPSVCYEMFPMTLVEAYAHGLPVLGSKLGGLASLIEDGRTGLTFEAGNAADLCAKAVWMTERPTETRTLGDGARARYLERHTIEKNHATLMQIYGEVRGRHSRGATPAP